MTDELVPDIVHVAGVVMCYGTVQVQRCSWCGMLIDSHDLSKMGVQEDSRPPERRGKPLGFEDLAHWEVGALVAIKYDGGNVSMRWTVEPELSEGELLDGKAVHKAPEHSCMRLYEGLELQA